MKEITKFITSVRIYLILSSFLRNAFLFLIGSVSLFVLYVIADYFFLLNRPSRASFYYFSLLIAFICALRFLFFVIKYSKTENVIFILEKELNVDKNIVLNAQQLHLKKAKDTSEELAEEHIIQTSRILKGLSPSNVIKLKSTIINPLILLSLLLICAFSFYLIPKLEYKTSYLRVLRAMSDSEWKMYFETSPKTSTFAWAAAVSIKAESIRDIVGLPILFIRSESGSWKRVNLNVNEYGIYEFKIEKLVENIDYYIIWGEWKTDLFKITPFMYPKLGDFKVVYVMPEYTNMGSLRSTNNPHLSAITGSTAKIECSSNKKLKSAVFEVSDGKKYKAQVKKDKVYADIPVLHSGSYKINCVAEDGTYNPDLLEYSIEAREDTSPDIELLSPKSDLLVSLKSEIPLIIRVQDDFGISKINLVYKKKGLGEKIIKLFEKDKSSYSAIFDYLWKLYYLDLSAGDKVQYYIQAYDNNIVSGPKSSKTKVYSIEITDYETEHKRIEEELEEFREKLLELLAVQMEARNLSDEYTNENSSSAYKALLDKQKEVNRDAEEPCKMLSELLEKMETDPMTDFATYQEYKSLNSHLDYIKNQPMKKAAESIDKKDMENAVKSQDEVISNLEKMSLLAEDIWKYQKMRDLLNTSSDAEKSAEEMLNSLTESKSPEELNKLLNEIDNLMSEISKKLSDIPQELPEDFRNAPSVKNIDLSTPKNLLEKLREAIANENWDEAKRLAEELKKKLSEISDSMGDVGNNIGFSQGASQKMESELSDYGQKLDEIIEKQKEVIKGIEALDNSRKGLLFKKQETMLKNLEEKQRKALEKAKEVLKVFNERIPGRNQTTQKSINLMQKVYDEFKAKRVYNSQKFLEDIIKNWQTESPKVDSQNFNEEAKTGALDGINYVAREEKEILDILKSPLESNLFDDKNRKNLKSLAEKEDDTSKETRGLESSLQKFMRQSALVNPEAFENLRHASKNMDDASAKVLKEDTSNSLESARRALEYLETGKDSVNNAMQSMSRQSMGAGSPISGPMQMLPGGKSGFRTEPVELPKKEDYKPPEEFRKEVLDALKEKYPEKYREIINEYYKRLTE